MEGGGVPEGLQCAVLVPLLRYLMERTHHHRKLLATTQHQLHAVPTMTLDELRKMVSGPGTLSPLEVRSRAWRGAWERARARRRELRCCVHARDSALLLVWARTRHALMLMPQLDHNTTG
ncbi:hypothetical protein O3G_MSEX000972, partial [Manduca sexta]